MNNLLKSVSIKYGLILAAAVLIGVTGTRFLVADATASARYIAFAVLAVLWVIKIFVIARSHYDYNQKNNGYMSFKDAILIGLIVIGISHAVSLVYGLIHAQFLQPESEPFIMSPVSLVFWNTLTSIIIDTVVFFFIILMESQWKIFRKAGKEGWASLIPFYNLIVLLEIVKKPAGWVIFMMIPMVNIIFGIWVVNLLAKRYGKDEGYTVGMLLLPFVFYPMLGLSKQEMIRFESPQPFA
jgi:hypothetical protein